MRRVLYVTYDFPPRRTSGIYRPTGLTKYLSRFGWLPAVLTIKAKEGNVEDLGLLEKVPPEVRVSRVRFLDVTAWERKPHAAARKLGALRSPAARKRPTVLDRFLRSMAAFVRSCLYFPDDTIGWVPFGLREALRLHRAQKFDVVYTTSPPRSTSLIGLLLKLLAGVRWIAEFRDPWYPSPRPWRRKFERMLLQRMLNRADRIIVISRGHGQELEQSYGIRRTKVAVVSNGYDEDEFSALNDAPSKLLEEGYFHLSHFGTVYPGFSGRFFEALASLLRECPELRNRLRVNIIGFPDEVVQHWAASDDLHGVVRLHGFVEHRAALQAMR